MSALAFEIENVNSPVMVHKTAEGGLLVAPDHTGSEFGASSQGSLPSTQTTAPVNYDGAVYNPNVPPTPRAYHYDGLIPTGYFCLWLGARKAEKSLFALQKAMCDACGANWLTYLNLLGPVPVLYIDSENHSHDIDERYREHVQAFTREQQELIHRNLRIVKAVELKERGINIELSNAEFWAYLAQKHADAQVIYLDCWYQLTSIKPGDAITARKAVEAFKEYFPKKTIFLLHHTANESKESRAKTNPVWLRVTGAERWSGNISEQSVLTKIAELVICQERYEPKDEEGLAETSVIDFQVFSRSSTGTPLMSFEADYGDESKGEDLRYRRRMTNILTTPAAAMLRALSGNGRSAVVFRSIPEIIKSAAKQKSAREYTAVRELILKGYLLQGRTPNGYEYRLRSDSAVEAALDAADSSPAAQKSAVDFLREKLCFADGTPNPDGIPRECLQQMVTATDITWQAVRQAKTRLKVIDETRHGQIFWRWPDKSKKAKQNKLPTGEQLTISEPDIPF